MTITRIATYKVVTRTAIVAAAGCAAFSLASPAVADTTEDLLTGGAYCGNTTPFSCDPTHLKLTVPQGANAVKLGFTQNNNPCGTDLTVNVYEGGKAYPLEQTVETPPGVHNVTVIPTCGQQMTSWGGAVHVTYITGGGTAGQTATVLQDSAIYNAANGTAYQKGGIDAFKPAGTKVQLVAPELCSGVADWCHIVGAPEVNGDAWIYAGKDANGKPFISQP